MHGLKNVKECIYLGLIIIISSALKCVVTSFFFGPQGFAITMAARDTNYVRDINHDHFLKCLVFI